MILNEKIVKIGNKYQVQSETGKNMGTYDTEKAAKKRLQQIEYFKHLNEALVSIEARPWEAQDLFYWYNPEDGTCNALIDYKGKKTRVRAELLIVKDNQVLLCKDNDSFSLPGGSIEIGETITEAAKREAQEEVNITAKNIKDTKLDYCAFNDEITTWVAENVPVKYQWYNYYTCLCIGDYDKEFKGHVDAIDQDPQMKKSADWYSIESVIDNPAFLASWKEALITFGYLDKANNILAESINTSYDKYNNYINPEFKFVINPEENIEEARKIETIIDNFKLPSYCKMYRDNCLTINNTISKLLTDNGYDTNVVQGFFIVDNLNLVDRIDLKTLQALDKFKQHTELTIPEFIIANNYLGKDIGWYTYIPHYWLQVNGLIIDRAWPMFIPALDGPVTKDRYSLNDYNVTLTEATRTQLISKSKNAGLYKNQTFGKNRFERKRYSKVANQVKSYNQIDMNTFFKQDTLEIKIPVIGENDTYNVTIRMEGVCSEIAKIIKSNNNKFEFKTVLQAVTKIFNTSDVYVNCSCDDFKWRFNHWAVVNNYGTTDTAHDPGPGKGIANPNNDLGIGCKHVLLVLANTDWIMKVTSVIHNYTTWMSEHKPALFAKLIFPKLYGMSEEDAIEADILPEDTKLDSNESIIDIINEWAKNRGKYKPGSNKNPVTSTGGRAKKIEEPEKDSE